jgi:dTDP-4-amino-4,6-dideoxygalactose transaminase
MAVKNKMAPVLMPMSSPDLTYLEVEAVGKVLQTRHLSLGPRLVEFEDRFAEYIGAPHAIAVSSGTAGLHLCVIAAGVGPGDLAITTPFSFVASANPILYERAIPVFVDIDPDTLSIDPAQVSAAADGIAAGGRSREAWIPTALKGRVRGELKAILPVHVFGEPAPMDEIRQVAGRHDLPIIEDACEAVGANHNGHKVGALGDAAVFAFYPNKQITTGEGGMIVTHRSEWNELFRSLRNQGRDVMDAWLNHDRLGYNYRLDEMSAALGLVQLDRIESLLARRERAASWYQERLKDIEGLSVPRELPPEFRRSWFVYVVCLAPEINREAVMAALREKNVPSRPYFTPIHLQPYYRERFGFREGQFPVAESVAKSTLALPFFSTIGEEQVDQVCGHLAAVLSEY